MRSARADLCEENAAARATRITVAERIDSIWNAATIAPSAEFTLLWRRTGAFIDQAVAVIVEAVATLCPGKGPHERNTAECPALALQRALRTNSCKPGETRAATTGIPFVDFAIAVIVESIAHFRSWEHFSNARTESAPVWQTRSRPGSTNSYPLGTRWTGIARLRIPGQTSETLASSVADDASTSCTRCASGQGAGCRYAIGTARAGTVVGDRRNIGIIGNGHDAAEPVADIRLAIAGDLIADERSIRGVGNATDPVGTCPCLALAVKANAIGSNRTF